MRTPITIEVRGVPQPAGSKRAFVLKKGGAFTGRAVVTDANPKSRDWKIDVQHEARMWFADEPWDCPIHITLRFTIARPKGHYGSGRNAAVLKHGAPPYPNSKPDCLKLSRGVEDALTGILYVDDSQIVTELISKRYGVPGVVIEMREETP